MNMHLYIHGQFMGVADDVDTLTRMVDAIKRRYGTFRYFTMQQPGSDGSMKMRYRHGFTDNI